MTREPAEDWRHRGACLIESPELFYPISTRPDHQTAEAKAVCRTCPVRDVCLTWALDTRLAHGIAGGLTENERRTLLNREQRAATRARRPMTPSAAHAAIAKAASVEAIAVKVEQTKAAVTTLTTQGESAAEISRRLGISARQVVRYRAAIRTTAATRKAAR